MKTSLEKLLCLWVEVGEKFFSFDVEEGWQWDIPFGIIVMEKPDLKSLIKKGGQL